jgi:hypothetical protein
VITIEIYSTEVSTKERCSASGFGVTFGPWGRLQHAAAVEEVVEEPSQVEMRTKMSVSMTFREAHGE